MGKKKLKSNVTFSPRHGPFSGVGNIALGAAAVCAANEAWGWGIEPWWALAGAGAGLLISQVGAHAAKVGVSSRVYQAVCWMAGGAWTGYVLENTLWDVPTVAAGVGAAFVAALAAPVVADLQRSRGQKAKALAEDDKRMRLGAQWVARLQRVCRIHGAQIKGITPWRYPDPETGVKRRTGYTIEVLIPQGGQGWKSIAQHREALATDLDLPVGCTVSVERGATGRRALIHVTTVNCLTKDIKLAMPKVLPASINDPLTIGLTTRGKPVALPLKWASGVLVGAKRQGKSNTIKSLARQALRCDDVLIIGVDPNGGAVFAPFLRPWLEGKVERPAIDWVAVDEAETIRMLEFWARAVERRRSGYAQHMWESGGDDKLAVSHKIPHILLLTDESKSLPAKAKDLLVQINDRGGAASVSMLTSWLRAIANGREGLPRDLLVQSEIRLTVRVNEDGELKHAFSHGRGIPAAGEAPAPGWGHFRPSPNDPAELYKSARSTDQDAYDEAIATGGFRPLLDAVTIGPERELYEGRWKRALEQGWLSKLCPQGVALEKVIAPVGSVSAGEGRIGGQGGPVEEMGGSVAERAAERATRRRQRTEEWRERVRRNSERDQGEQEVPEGVGVGFPALSDEEIRARFEVMSAALEQESEKGPGPVREFPLPPFLEAVLGLLQELDTDGLHRKVLADHLTLGDREWASKLMRALEVKAWEGTFRMSGHPGFGSARGWKREAIEAVAEQIRAGRAVPEQVLEWTDPA